MIGIEGVREEEASVEARYSAASMLDTLRRIPCYDARGETEEEPRSTHREVDSTLRGNDGKCAEAWILCSFPCDCT